jgi:hypothetical protein
MIIIFLSENIKNALFTARPRNTDAQDADTSSMSIKRRLPFEVKQKLAKVARLAVTESIFLFFICESLHMCMCAHTQSMCMIFKLIISLVSAAVKPRKNIRGINRSPYDHSWAFNSAEDTEGIQFCHNCINS